MNDLPIPKDIHHKPSLQIGSSLEKSFDKILKEAMDSAIALPLEEKSPVIPDHATSSILFKRGDSVMYPVGTTFIDKGIVFRDENPNSLLIEVIINGEIMLFESKKLMSFDYRYKGYLIWKCSCGYTSGSYGFYVLIWNCPKCGKRNGGHY